MIKNVKKSWNTKIQIYYKTQLFTLWTYDKSFQYKDSLVKWDRIKQSVFSVSEFDKKILRLKFIYLISILIL